MIKYDSFIIEENEHLYGPGKRLVLFMQGCLLRCPGCANEHLWDFSNGEKISIDELVNLCHDLDGITLHGGEPLDQSEELLTLVKKLKEDKKTIILFTGYKFKELEIYSQKQVWKLSDIVISGRYIKEKRNIYLQFRGSTNQRIFKHKGKYRNYKIKDGFTAGIITLSNDGKLTSLGFQNDELENLIIELESNIKE